MQVVNLDALDASMIAIAGGKAANLGELIRLGVDVPSGFCITTEAFGQLAEAEIAARIDPSAVYAVRSSATMEDLPNTSFAGQHDTFLGVVGAAEVFRHVQRCWDGLVNERAVAYRKRNGLDETKAKMAVVVQKLVPAKVAGVLFTADPVTGNRKVTSVEAVFGLGEQLVSGHVTPDIYKVRGDEVLERNVHGAATLTDAQLHQLVAIGRRIEAHFGRPQDIEWCLDDRDRFFIVQSRAITTLFPIPAGNDDAHVYISVGHQQMMTDAMRPLGLSFYLAITPARMVTAGGRLFVDVAPQLASPAMRAPLLGMMKRSDPLIHDAIETVVARGFVPERADPPRPPAPPKEPPLEADPERVPALIASTQASIAKAAEEITGKSGVALLDFIVADLEELKRVLRNVESTRTFMSGMEATWWLNDTLEAWLGEKNAADKVAQSVPHNITSEMGLALLDVADAMRSHSDEKEALAAWLTKYGMRCAGEIDITRPRWSERPEALLPLIRNMESFEPGEAARRFERGLAEAAATEADLLARVGEARATETKRAIDRVRAYAGYREYPKYAYICRYWIYKQALMREAARLVDTGVLRAADDIFYLSLTELHDVVRANAADAKVIAERREAFAHFETLTPPRVLTSEGEGVSGSYRRDVPAGALVGLPVSAGTVTGRARVIFDVGDASLEPGDILVTPFTDPSWTPVFVAIAGLVTEVGGLMTHGAVIAREYGLPAIVGVEHATTRIKDGQTIRVHGRDGYVELL